MTNLQAYYRANTVSALDDYLAQVGHTVNGRTINEAEFEAMSQQIVNALSLNEDDLLLDLCCGNGLFSHRLADSVRGVTGVDFSLPLLEVARKVHSADNICYYQMDIFEISRLAETGGRQFTKVLLHAALQHFSQVKLDAILDQLDPITGGQAIIYLGLVPDRDLKWRFYNTPMRIFNHFARWLTGTERIGHWWGKREMEAVCRRRNLSCLFESPPDWTHTATYRFNAILCPINNLGV